MDDRSWRLGPIPTTDRHTAGEPFRIVEHGGPSAGGGGERSDRSPTAARAEIVAPDPGGLVPARSTWTTSRTSTSAPSQGPICRARTTSPLTVSLISSPA